MQSTVYKCDECLKEIGKKKHISLIVAGSEFAGIALPPNHENEAEVVKMKKEGLMVRRQWIVVTNKIKGVFMHFCNGQCIGRYFSARMKEAV